MCSSWTSIEPGSREGSVTRRGWQYSSSGRVASEAPRLAHQVLKGRPTARCHGPSTQRDGSPLRSKSHSLKLFSASFFTSLLFLSLEALPVILQS